MSCFMSPCHVISNVISFQISCHFICLLMSCHIISCHMSYHIVCHVMSYVMLCNIISHVIICHAMSWHIVSYVILFHVICHVISYHMSHHMSYQMMRKILNSTLYIVKKNTPVLHGGGRGVLLYSLINTYSQIMCTTKTESPKCWWPNLIKGKRD